MGYSYAMDLCERISGYIAAGHSRRAAARAFVDSASTAVWLAAEYRDRGARSRQSAKAVHPGPQASSDRTLRSWSRSSGPNLTSH